MSLPHDLARGELDSVADKVRNNLAQTQRVTDELIRNVWVNVICEVKVVLRWSYNESLEVTENRVSQ